MAAVMGPPTKEHDPIGDAYDEGYAAGQTEIARLRLNYREMCNCAEGWEATAGRLRTALEPFAVSASRYSPSYSDKDMATIQIGLLRQAEKALANEQKD
jgi:hypothetical protein